MQKKTNLKIDYATYQSAKYACENWHYSKCLPPSKSVKFGVWEENKFIGVVVFGVGATPNLCKPYSLKNTEVCELVRIALRKHLNPVTRILSLSIKMLKKTNPNLKLIISFADQNQGHVGSIYQAGNWVFTGISKSCNFLLIDGNLIHPRQITRLRKRNDKSLMRSKKIIQLGKYRYLFPLCNQIRERISLLSKPYPKCAKSKDSVASADQVEGSGEIPTLALQEVSCG